MGKSTAEHRRWEHTNLLAALAGAGQHDRLFKALEEKRYLLDQARYTSGYEQGTRDLEGHVLPVAIKIAAWPRFLRFALVAIHFRGLASALTEPQLLRALVVGGQIDLARRLAGQLAEPLDRARARALIHETLKDPAGKAAGEAIDDLENAPPPDDDSEADAWLETLTEVARHLEPDVLAPRWSGWIARLEHAPAGERHAERIAAAWRVASASLGRHDLRPSSQLWPALAKTGPRAWLLGFLPPLLASHNTASSWLEQSLLPPFDADRDLLWHVRIAVLAHGALAPAQIWRRLTDVPVWSPELIMTGRMLWPKLGAAHLAELAARITDAAPRAVLLISALEGDADLDLDALARAALDQITDPAEQLHGWLRFLATRSCCDRKADEVRQLARHLERLRYDTPAENLTRFLDLVATARPKELRREVENVVWAPASTAATLRMLATAGQEPALLEQLLERAEEYAAAVADDQAQGFGLRRELLVGLGARLFFQGKSAKWLGEVAERLLPEEEDELRVAVVEKLSSQELKPGEPDRRPPQVEKIRSKQRQWLMRLRLASTQEQLSKLVDPAELYRAAIVDDFARDELRAQKALLEKPDDPDALARREIEPIRDPDRRLLALVDLAHRTLDHQRRQPRWMPRDPLAALQPLALAVGYTTSDARLLALTPELAMLGAQVGPGRAVAEFQEAFLRVLQLETMGEKARLETLWTLFGAIGPVFFGTPEHKAYRRAGERLQRWLEGLPKRSELQTEGYRELWRKAREEQPTQDDAAEPLVDQIAEDRLDPLDPRCTTLRRELRRPGGSVDIQKLAGAVVRALQNGGRAAGERALCFWLDAYLQPEAPEAARRFAEAERVLDLAHEL